MNLSKAKSDFKNWWDRICKENNTGYFSYEFPYCNLNSNIDGGITFAGKDISEELIGYEVNFAASYEEPTFVNNKWLIECMITENREDALPNDDIYAIGESYEGCEDAFNKALENLRPQLERNDA